MTDTTADDTERAAFEAWAKDHGRLFLDTQPANVACFGVLYKNQWTQEAWVGWQARASLAAPPAPAPPTEPVINANALALHDADSASSLISRLQDEADLCRNEGADDIAGLLEEAAKALTAQPEPVNAQMLEALKALLKRDERNTCQHEETHRGGAQWTICNMCCQKWADDEGGMPEWQDPPEWDKARAAIAAAEAAQAEPAAAPWREAFNEARDAVLNERGPLEGEGADSGVINAVLAIMDDAFASCLADAAAPSPTPQPAPAGVVPPAVREAYEALYGASTLVTSDKMTASRYLDGCPALLLIRFNTDAAAERAHAALRLLEDAAGGLNPSSAAAYWSQPAGVVEALRIAEAALSDIGDADREPGDDLAWCESRAAQDLPMIRAALAAADAALAAPVAKQQPYGDLRCAKWLDPECYEAGACQSLLFKAPPVQAVPLTYEQRDALWAAYRQRFDLYDPTDEKWRAFHEGVEAAERAHGIGITGDTNAR